MIKINFLPPELRLKKKRKSASSGASAMALKDLPIVPILIGGGVIFVLLTAYLFVTYLFMLGEYKTINEKWQTLSPQMNELRSLEERVEKNLTADKNFFSEHVLIQSPVTYILEWVSEYLPEKTWVTSFALDNEKGSHGFRLEGISLSSKDASGIEKVERYLYALKQRIPNSDFTYSTTKQVYEGIDGTAYKADFSWSTVEAGASV